MFRFGRGRNMEHSVLSGLENPPPTPPLFHQIKHKEKDNPPPPPTEPCLLPTFLHTRPWGVDFTSYETPLERSLPPAPTMCPASSTSPSPLVIKPLSLVPLSPPFGQDKGAHTCASASYGTVAVRSRFLFLPSSATLVYAWM